MIRIAITGPESSGKTTLALTISRELNAEFIPEFAREYLSKLGRDYVREDLVQISDGQRDAFIKSTTPIQVVDTDFIVLKVWSEFKYATVDPKILQEIESNHFDLHILCTPDIPWEEDELREHPDQREELFEIYLDELINAKKNFILVSGTPTERLEKSLEAINSIQK